MSMDGADYYLFHVPEASETPAALSHDTLSLITEKSDKSSVSKAVRATGLTWALT